MLNVVVIGAGFAGVWSALAATRVVRDLDAADRVKVYVVAPNDDLVIRPRLYQADPARHRVPLHELFDEEIVEHVRGTVTEINYPARTVEVFGRGGDPVTLAWDRLVLASGSQILQPSIPGAQLIHNVDTLDAARALEQHLEDLSERDIPAKWTAAVVGSGFAGLEVATELLARLRQRAGSSSGDEAPRVVLIERSGHVAPSLGDGPKRAIARQLAQAGVELRLGDGVARYDGNSVVLESGARIDAATVVWTVGMEANRLTAQLPGRRDALGRLEVDDYLRLPIAANVYVAGDTAAARVDGDHVTTQSCQHAIPLGKTAGWNAAVDLLGFPESRTPFQPGPYVTCLDLGDGGAVFTTGWERTVQLVGLEAKQVKAYINDLIRPPAGSPELLLEQADPRWVPDGLAVA